MGRFRGTFCLLAVWVAVCALALAGCAGAKHKPGEAFSCVSEGGLSKTIAPEAQLETFTCLFKKYEGAQTLHFNVTVKNISSQAQRFRVNIYLDNGKAVGGLIPPNTKKGLVEPGQSASFVYPVTGMTTEPKTVELVIKTIGE
jgi:hypothetical protein